MSGYFDHHQQVQYGLPFWSPTPTKSELAKSELAKSELAKSELAHHIHGPSYLWPVIFMASYVHCQRIITIDFDLAGKSRPIASGSSPLILTLRANQGQYRAENRHNQARMTLMGVGPAIGNSRLGDNRHRQC